MELTEKQKNCPYCHKGPNQKALFTETDFTREGEKSLTFFYVDRITDSYGRTIAKRKPNYCEDCGRPLRGDD